MILIVDDSLGRHLAAAVKAHVRELRREGTPIPTALADLAAVAATGGLRRPAFDAEQATEDPAGVDQRLTVDYRTAAFRLGISDRSVQRLVAAGELPAVDVAGNVRIRTRDLTDYVDSLPVRGKATA